MKDCGGNEGLAAFVDKATEGGGVVSLNPEGLLGIYPGVSRHQTTHLKTTRS